MFACDWSNHKDVAQSAITLERAGYLVKFHQIIEILWFNYYILMENFV